MDPDEALEQLQQQVRAACERGEHGLEIEVMVWPMEGLDVGHSALRIGNLVLGYYPTDVNGDGRYNAKDLSSSPGDLHVDTVRESREIYRGQRVQRFMLSIDCETVLCLIEFYLALLGRLGTYSILSRNCTTIAADALAHCGLDMTATFPYPASEYGNLLLATPGTVTLVETGICTHTVRLDHKSVISPNQLAERLKGKPFVTGMTEEVVGQ
jgi:hypothetical protein